MPANDSVAPWFTEIQAEVLIVDEFIATLAKSKEMCKQHKKVLFQVLYAVAKILRNPKSIVHNVIQRI